MKQLIRTSHTYYILLALLVAFIAIPMDTYGQKKERTRLKAYYEKLTTNDKKISIILTQGRGKSMKGVGDAAIKLKTSSPDSSVAMGTIHTDSLGAAELFIEADYPFLKNEEGYYTLEASFRGNDSLRGSKKTIEFMDLHLALSLEEVDSVKNVEVRAFTRNDEGDEQAVEALDFKVGVKRLLSNLYLDEIETNEEGIATSAFPNDIPGDSVGKLTVVVRFEDHEEYGTVTKTMEVNWGTPVDYSNTSTGRSLFGDSAPWWMIISVAIILLGAWVHFLWAIMKVYKIKKYA